ncbi:MAG: hypothetical protein K2K63_03245 [Acetatifactor sp.]|nr:hypothetical protein [Acetatifactor sp.]
MEQSENMSEFRVVQLDEDVLPAASYLLTMAEQKLLRGRRAFAGVAAFSGPVCVGIALFTTEQTALLLERLMVVASYRRQGVASSILRMLSGLAKNSGKRLVVPFAAAGQRDPVYRLLASQRCLYIRRQEGFEARIEREDALRAYDQLRGKNKRAPEMLFSQPRSRLQAFEAAVSSDFPSIGTELCTGAEGFRRDLCTCRVSNGIVRAACLIGQNTDGISLRLLYASRGYGALAVGTLADAMRLTFEKTNESSFTTVVTNDAAARLLEELCPSYTVSRRLFVAIDAN